MHRKMSSHLSRTCDLQREGSIIGKPLILTFLTGDSAIKYVELVMQKRLSLILLILIFALALFSAYYPPDDEALRQGSTLTDIYDQLLFGVTILFMISATI